MVILDHRGLLPRSKPAEVEVPISGEIPEQSHNRSVILASLWHGYHMNQIWRQVSIFRVVKTHSHTINIRRAYLDTISPEHVNRPHIWSDIAASSFVRLFSIWRQVSIFRVVKTHQRIYIRDVYLDTISPEHVNRPHSQSDIAAPSFVRFFPIVSHLIYGASRFWNHDNHWWVIYVRSSLRRARAKLMIQISSWSC